MYGFHAATEIAHTTNILRVTKERKDRRNMFGGEMTNKEFAMRLQAFRIDRFLSPPHPHPQHSNKKYRNLPLISPQGEVAKIDNNAVSSKLSLKLQKEQKKFQSSISFYNLSEETDKLLLPPKFITNMVKSFL